MNPISLNHARRPHGGLWILAMCNKTKRGLRIWRDEPVTCPRCLKALAATVKEAP
jgi:hypothetical protein